MMQQCQNRKQRTENREQKTETVFCSLFIVLFLFFITASSANAFTLPDHKYPRTAAFFLKTSRFSSEEIQALAKFQVLILDAQTQVTNRDVLTRLRDMNPTIILLAYTSGVEYPLNRLESIESPGGIWHQIGEKLEPEWFLKTANGQYVSFWPGNVMMNPESRTTTGLSYAGYLSDFLAEKVLATGLWDGLFFDTVWDGIFWLNQDIDIDRDGVRDDKEKVDRAWRDGQNLFFQALRAHFGDQYLLLGNGVLEPYAQYLNGRMFESFPDPSEGGWAGSVKRYQTIAAIGSSPHITVLNADTGNTGNWRDWNRMRHGLASALLLDGYYSFDYGTQVRDLLYWYDEYDVSLGKPSSFSARNIVREGSTVVEKGVWRRDFQYGMVLVNSTDTAQTIQLEEEFERIHGKQDSATNDGTIASRVTLPSTAGLLLMRPIVAMRKAPFVNGAFARVFNKYGDVVRTGFFAYATGQRGGTTLAYHDVDRDGKEETVIAENDRIVIQNADGTTRRQFFPYGEGATFGIRFSIGDIDRDGRYELVTVPLRGGNAHVKVFRLDGTFLRGWLAYGPNASYGASVALGDLDGDGTLEIITGAGVGGVPRVRAFRADGSVVHNGWLAYSRGFRGGVLVASGDLDGDRRAEIITGTGRGGGPQVRIFSGEGKVLHPGFFAFAPTKREGVEVAAEDFDGDGKAEIVALSTNVFTTAQLFRR